MPGPRLLFVDDEPRILEGLENLLFDREDWELVFVTSGEAALATLAQGKRFDAIVTDLRMPGMDGLTLMQRVLAGYPHLLRIVLSGDAELQVAMQAFSIAHQYIAKPCEAPQLVAAIERALHMGTVVRDHQLRRNLATIVDLPHDRARLREVYQLASTAEASIAMVARAVQRDICLTTKLLQAASSPMFGGTQISSVASAITRIGLEGVRSLALSLEIHSRMPATTSPLVAACQRRSLRVATLASSLATCEADRAYVCGLLDDLGTLALARHFPERLEGVRAAWQAGKGDLLELERAELGIDHIALGAEILELFGLHEIAKIVRHGRQPSASGQPARLDALGALHVATATVDASASAVAPFDAAFLSALGPAAAVTLLRARNLARAA